MPGEKYGGVNAYQPPTKGKSRISASSRGAPESACVEQNALEERQECPHFIS